MPTKHIFRIHVSYRCKAQIQAVKEAFNIIIANLITFFLVLESGPAMIIAFRPTRIIAHILHHRNCSAAKIRKVSSQNMEPGVGRENAKRIGAIRRALAEFAWRS